MKKYICFLLAMLTLAVSCTKKTEEEEEPTGWTSDDQAALNNIRSLQNQAVQNYNTWIATMDSLDVISQLQQFFANDPNVSSATISRQGIAVQYTNGMRGGLFINPRNGTTLGKLKDKGSNQANAGDRGIKALVNKKKMVYFSPCHAQFSMYSNMTIQNYYDYLPKVGFAVDGVYKDYDVTLDRFLGLNAYGIIHFDSHGWAWPEENSITDVYFQTADVLDDDEAAHYATDVKNGNIVLPKIFEGFGEEWSDFCLISEKFILAHNDFSKDTVFFFGAFCYSFLGHWDELAKHAAKGAYFGMDWAVSEYNCTNWTISLVDSLCDTAAKVPFTTGKWITGTNPPKYYFDPDVNKNVNIKYYGDPDLVFWKSGKVETLPITKITETTASGGGKITLAPDTPVSSRGICWSISQNPTTSDSHTTDGSGTGQFTSEITGLSPNTKYYVRAYAIVNQVTLYGDQVSFTTQQSGGQTVTDIDGNVYHLITIGTQVWLGENLKTTHYSNGDAVPNLTKNIDWSETKNGAWCDNNNDGSNGQTYGHLYNWRAAADPRNLCPDGWHVPTDAEWTALDDFLLWHVGGKLKEAGTTHWASPNTGATNESGFTALPGGGRSYGGLFSEPGNAAAFWSSTPDTDPNNAYYRQLLYDDDFMYRNVPTWIEGGLSVRCLKN